MLALSQNLLRFYRQYRGEPGQPRGSLLDLFFYAMRRHASFFSINLQVVFCSISYQFCLLHLATILHFCSLVT